MTRAASPLSSSRRGGPLPLRPGGRRDAGGHAEAVEAQVPSPVTRWSDAGHCDTLARRSRSAPRPTRPSSTDRAPR